MSMLDNKSVTPEPSKSASCLCAQCISVGLLELLPRFADLPTSILSRAPSRITIRHLSLPLLLHHFLLHADPARRSIVETSTHSSVSIIILDTLFHTSVISIAAHHHPLASPFPARQKSSHTRTWRTSIHTNTTPTYPKLASNFDPTQPTQQEEVMTRLIQADRQDNDGRRNSGIPQGQSLRRPNYPSDQDRQRSFRTALTSVDDRHRHIDLSHGDNMSASSLPPPLPMATNALGTAPATLAISTNGNMTLHEVLGHPSSAAAFIRTGCHPIGNRHISGDSAHGVSPGTTSSELLAVIDAVLDLVQEDDNHGARSSRAVDGICPIEQLGNPH